MDKTTIDALGERLRRMERKCLRWRLAGGIAALGGAILLFVGGAPLARDARTVEGERFVLRDAAGKTRLLIGVGEGGPPFLRFFDGEGKARLELGLRGDGSADVSLLGRDEHPLAQLNSGAGDSSQLLLAGQKGRGIIGLQTTPEGAGAVTGYGKDGSVRFMVFVAPDGAPSLNFFDQPERPRLTLDLRSGEPNLKLTGDDGKPGVLLSVTKDGPLLGLQDKGQRNTLGLAIHPVGGASLYGHNKDRGNNLYLGVHQDGTSQLTFSEQDERMHATLGADGGNAWLTLCDRKGETRASLSVDRGGTVTSLGLSPRAR
jgi:hypothetical protein